MAIIPANENTTHTKLNTGEGEKTVGRGYMGLSGIGNPCIRALQYSFYMAYENFISDRVKRIFDTGNIAEEFMINDLNKIGVIVWGEQDEIICFAGHWKGHIDGRCLNVIEAPKTPHLLELKTHNQRSFNAVVKHGVKKSKPMHYSQMQIYMDGIEYNRGLYVAYCKNTSEYYAERIRLDKTHIADLKDKQKEVLFAEKLHNRIGNNRPDYYECRFCNAKEVCFGEIEILKNCGTCRYRDVYINGIFKCGKNNDKILSWDEMLMGCSEWRKSEMFSLF